MATLVGYSGGEKEAPTYRSLGDHTEVVLVAFDPSRVGFVELLETFWQSHDPRAAMPWKQYRNVVFYHNEIQRETIEASLLVLEAKLEAKVVTDIEPADPFHPAEDYHQKYALRRNKRLMKTLKDRFEDESAFVASTLAARLNGHLGGELSREALERALETLGLTEEERLSLLRLASGS